jgi:hypothetical protein
LVVILCGSALFGVGYAVAQGERTDAEAISEVNKLLSLYGPGANYNRAKANEIYREGLAKGLQEGELAKWIKEQTAAFAPEGEATARRSRREGGRQARLVGSDPVLASEAGMAIYQQYWTRNSIAQGATQQSALSNEALMSLQALQVAQNARIIELLEKLAGKK